MNNYKFKIFFFTIAFSFNANLVSSQTVGCYSNYSSKFYYVDTGGNDYTSSFFALQVPGGATCNTFSTGNYTGGNCKIDGVLNTTYYFNATTNLIYPCPFDDYVPYLTILAGIIGFYFLRSRFGYVNSYQIANFLEK